MLGRGDIEVNGKSIMGIMMLAAAKGTELTLRAEGEDAEAALNALEDLVNDRFGEEE
jgi:phosphocarrier protein